MPAARSRKETVADVERPAEVRRLDQQVGRVAGEREAEQLVVRPVELCEIELAARHEPERVTDRGLHGGQRGLHLVGRRRVVVAHVRRRREHGDAVGERVPADRKRFVEILSPIVEARKNMTVKVDQSCANASSSSRAARIPAGTYSATRRSFGE